MKWLLALAPFAIILLWYILSGREWLKKQAWAQGFFAWIEPIEIALYKKSETILAGRLIWVSSLLIGAYDSIAVFASGQNWTPVTARVLAGIPPDMHGIVVSVTIFMIGMLISWLRKRTTKPLEVVAVAEKDITPAVAEAMAVAEVAKVEAVAVVNAETARS